MVIHPFWQTFKFQEKDGVVAVKFQYIIEAKKKKEVILS